MFEGCSFFKVFKVLLVFCLALVLLQYILNLLVYNYSSAILGYVLNLSRQVNNGDFLKGSISNKNTYQNVSEETLSRTNSQSSSSPSSSLSSLLSSSSSLSNISLIYSSKDGISVPHDGSTTITSLPVCPLIPPKLVGPLATYTNPINFDEILKQNPDLKPGGRYKPNDCIARHRVAIIIPYRNREEHLKVFLRNVHPMLKRQLIDYGIYVVDMELPTKFNRAMLMNIGFVESLKIYDYQCFIFHDVDLIPENDRNLYTCPESPRHMSVAIDKFNYRLPYAAIFGGVSALTKEQMYKINGFSNKFFGWGGEDDDMHGRITRKGYKILRYAVDIARYKMIKHTRESNNSPNPKRFSLIKTGKTRQDKDGINSLKYKIVKIEYKPTYTYILTQINEEEVNKS